MKGIWEIDQIIIKIIDLDRLTKTKEVKIRINRIKIDGEHFRDRV